MGGPGGGLPGGPVPETGGGGGGGGGGGNEAGGGIMGGIGPFRFMAAARAAAAADAVADAGGGGSGPPTAAGFSGVDLGLPTASASETECEKDVTVPSLLLSFFVPALRGLVLNVAQKGERDESEQ